MPNYLIKNVLDDKQVESLLEYHYITDHVTDARPDVRSKHPIWDQTNWPQSIVQRVLDQILDYQYRVDEAIFLESFLSFKLHVDSGDGQASCLDGHVVLIPLLIDGVGGTVLFDNHWHNKATKFTRIPTDEFGYDLRDKHGKWVHVPDLRTLYQQCLEHPETVADFDVTQDFKHQISDLIKARMGQKLAPAPDGRSCDYSNITNYHQDQQFDQALHKQYLNHVPIENLHGLTVESVVPWQVGDVIAFPRTQLHAAMAGHERKIGITVFTRRIG